MYSGVIPLFNHALPWKRRSVASGCSECSARRASASMSCAIGEPRYDFVLHIEQIGDGLLKTFGPKMMTGFGVDQLRVYPETLATALHGAFEHVADVQLAADLPNVSHCALKTERRVAGDDK